QAARAIPVQQRRGLARVHREAIAHRRLAVVLALIELAAAAITHARRRRRRRDEVERGLARAAHPAAGEAPQQLRLRDVEVHDALERPAEVLEQALEAFRL